MKLSTRAMMTVVLATFLLVMSNVPALSTTVELGSKDQGAVSSARAEEEAVELTGASGEQDAIELSGDAASSEEASREAQRSAAQGDASSDGELDLVAQADNTRTVSTLVELFNALNEMNSGEIIVNPGTYALDRTIRLHSNMTLTLKDGATITRGSLEGPMVMNSDGSAGGYNRDRDIVIQGGVWDSAKNAGKYASIMHFDHAQGITLKNTTLKNCTHDHVVMLDGINNATIDNVTFKDDVSKSFSFVFEAVHIDACADESGTPGGSCKPLDNTCSQSITVKNCTFDNVITAAGCHPHAGPNPENKHLTFCNNTIKKVANGGSVFNAIRANDVKIYGNKYTGSGAECFVRLESTKNFDVHDNQANGVKFFAWAYVQPNDGRDVSHGWETTGKLRNNIATAITEAGVKAYDVKGPITLENEKYTSVALRKNYDSMVLYIDTSKDKTSLTTKSCTFNGPIVSDIPAQAYLGGAAIKPKVTVKNGSTTLKEGTDYTVSYKNNTKKGTATATVKGKGTYTGSVDKNFTIKTMTPNWSGASRIPVSALADIQVTNGGYIRLKSGGKWVTSDSILNLSSVNTSKKRISGKKAGSTTLYLLNADGKEVKSKRVTVYDLSGKWEIQSSVDKNYVLDIRGRSKANSARMIVWKRNNGQNQRYQFLKQTDGTYIIRCCHSGKVVDVQGGGTAKSQPVIQYTKNGRDNQRWKVWVDASNRVTLASKKSGMCFDIQGGKVTDRAQMIQWPSNGKNNQKWVLNKK